MSCDTRDECCTDIFRLKNFEKGPKQHALDGVEICDIAPGNSSVLVLAPTRIYVLDAANISHLQSIIEIKAEQVRTGTLHCDKMALSDDEDYVVVACHNTTNSQGFLTVIILGEFPTTVAVLPTTTFEIVLDIKVLQDKIFAISVLKHAHDRVLAL
jgi:hypothetical protein